MSLIYLSSSSSEAEPLSMRIASQCESILGSGCFLSKNNEKFLTQKIRLEIEACDVLIIVIAKTISENIHAKITSLLWTNPSGVTASWA